MAHPVRLQHAEPSGEFHVPIQDHHRWRQREKRTLEGLLARRVKDDLVRLRQDPQRLLRPIAVVNSYAPRLTFLDTRTPHAAGP
jgi:hypothetical protein